MRVLICEDDTLVLPDIVREFDKSGESFEVITATTAEEACRKIRQYRPDVVVTDTCLLGGVPNSAPVIRLAKNLGAKVVSMSSDERYRAYCTEAGADTFFNKFRGESLRYNFPAIREFVSGLSSSS